MQCAEKVYTVLLFLASFTDVWCIRGVKVLKKSKVG